jgi:hypothetical protein
MNAEFQWWLLILGIVIGGGLVYLVMADLRTDEDEAIADESDPLERAQGDDDEIVRAADASGLAAAPDRSQAAGPDLGPRDQPGPTIPT